MSVRVTLNCQVKPGEFNRLLPFLEANLPNVRGFKGCQQVSVLFNEETEQMLLDEQWQSVQHHQDYIAFISDNGVLGQLAAFLTAAPDIRYFSAVDI